MGHQCTCTSQIIFVNKRYQQSLLKQNIRGMPGRQRTTGAWKESRKFSQIKINKVIEQDHTRHNHGFHLNQMYNIGRKRTNLAHRTQRVVIHGYTRK
jgi:hypothetical protein